MASPPPGLLAMTALEREQQRPSVRELERAGQMRLPVYPFVNSARPTPSPLILSLSKDRP
jgi:hypothetical protein